MRRLAAAIGIVLLLLVGGALGYDAYRKSSSALLGRAQAHAMMPSCPGARASWLREREGGVDVTQYADIRADNECMTAWAATLGRAKSGFDCDRQKGHLRCTNLLRNRSPLAWGASVEFLPDRAQLTLWS